MCKISKYKKKCNLGFRKHIITFFGILKEQAHSLGVPDFELKIFRLQINNGKAKIMIQTQAQWDLERASLTGSCWELIVSYCGRCRFGPGLIVLSWVVSSKFRGWVFRMGYKTPYSEPQTPKALTKIAELSHTTT